MAQEQIESSVERQWRERIERIEHSRVLRQELADGVDVLFV